MSQDETVEENTQTIFVAEEYLSSEEPPMDEWSSLIHVAAEDNEKKFLYEQGMYHPGSGEICAKNIAMSDSSVLRHPFFNYPAVHNPGVKKALLQPEPPLIYSDDGLELYLAICKDMGQCPVGIFARGLLEEEIDLRYYCVDPKGVRPMAKALNYNKMVKVFNLTDNFLSDDACFHLGEMLQMNSTLHELNLSGCKIQTSGALRLFNGLTLNGSLKYLNLDKNELGDTGLECIANAVLQGLDIQKLYLSYNGIGGRGASALAEALEIRNTFIVLDLSWNNLIPPLPTCNLLAVLSDSHIIEEVNLAWNSLTGPRIGNAIKLLLKAPNLKLLNVSNNRFEGEAIANIVAGLSFAKKLVTIDLSFNPMSPADAVVVLTKMKSGAVKVQNVRMENVFVNSEFLMLLNDIKKLKTRKNFVISYGGVIPDFTGEGPDPRELLLNRADFLASKSKKYPMDIALFVQDLVLRKKYDVMLVKEFIELISSTGTSLDDDLLYELCNTFVLSRTAKNKEINLKVMAEYMMRKWPDRKLPPTPPPEPEPELPAVIKNANKKGKGKGKK